MKITRKALLQALLASPLATLLPKRAEAETAGDLLYVSSNGATALPEWKTMRLDAFDVMACEESRFRIYHDCLDRAIPWQDRPWLEAGFPEIPAEIKSWYDARTDDFVIQWR